MFSEDLPETDLDDPVSLSQISKLDIYIPTPIGCQNLRYIKATLKLTNLILLSLYVLYLIQCQWIYLPIDKTFLVAKNVEVTYSHEESSNCCTSFTKRFN